MSGWSLRLRKGEGEGLIAPAGYDHCEQLWRLTPAGRAGCHRERESA
jgi:hypothetical protein